MIARFVPAILLLLATPAIAQPAAPPAPVPAAPQTRLVRVVLTTALGPITLALDEGRAPITTANFLRYVDGRKLDGTNFYRATNIGQGYGLIQGGTRNDPKRTLPPIRHEPTSVTGLSHVDGAIAMGRNAPGTAAGDFFIVIGDLKSMDADPAAPGDNLGFAVFGRVVEGMAVVKAILAAPVSPTAGEGVMQGQMLEPKVAIVTARRAPPPPAP